MTVIENSISHTSETYQANRAGMLAQIARVNAVVGRTVAASELSKKRFHERGQLLPRERIALLLDPGAPFLELSALAGYCLDTPDPEKSIPGGGTIAGIGFVSGVRCMVTASDSGIEAGSLQPMGLDKRLRSQEIALENKLPYRCSWWKAPVRTSCAIKRGALHPRRHDLPQSGAAVGGRACRSSPSPTAHRRPAAPIRPASPTTSSWCAAAPAPSWPGRRC